MNNNQTTTNPQDEEEKRISKLRYYTEWALAGFPKRGPAKSFALRPS